MEQNNNILPQEHPEAFASPSVSAEPSFQQEQNISEDYIVTSYGVISREDVEKIISANYDLGGISKPSRKKRILPWIFGILGGVAILLLCLTLCFLAFKLNIEKKPDIQAPQFSFDEDFFHIPDFNITPNVSGSDQPDASQPSETSNAGLGVIVSALDTSSSTMYGIPGGLVIVGILEPSSFSGTEVKVYDIITSAEGIQITSTTALAALLDKHQIGDKFTMTITRFTDGFAESFDVTVSLIDKTKSE